MTILTILSCLMPFAIEVIGDKILIAKEKKDITLWVRILLVIAFTTTFNFESWNNIDLHNTSDRILLACAPFFLFDPVLNLVRGLKWDYSGKTKSWDVWTGRINPYAGLTLRIILFAGCITLILI